MGVHTGDSESPSRTRKKNASTTREYSAPLARPPPGGDVITRTVGVEIPAGFDRADRRITARTQCTPAYGTVIANERHAFRVARASGQTKPSGFQSRRNRRRPLSAIARASLDELPSTEAFPPHKTSPAAFRTDPSTRWSLSNSQSGYSSRLSIPGSGKHDPSSPAARKLKVVWRMMAITPARFVKRRALAEKQKSDPLHVETAHAMARPKLTPRSSLYCGQDNKNCNALRPNGTSPIGVRHDAVDRGLPTR